MPTLHLMCGLPGAGKTTAARRLERRHGALRLAPDEWMQRIVGNGDDQARRAAVESLQWELAQRVLRLGVDVILEAGCWSRRERDMYRAGARELGAEAEVHFLDVPRDELVRRLAARNAALPPDTFRVEPKDLDSWIRVFEPPTDEELVGGPALPGATAAPAAERVRGRGRILPEAPRAHSVVEPSPDAADIQTIRDGLASFNRVHAGDDHHQVLCVLLRDDDAVVVGGLLGGTYWGWLHIDVVWVMQAFRARGFGGLLLAAAEREACARGCHNAHLDSMSFQALPFYLRHGYSVFGELTDLPRGHSRYFMRKALRTGP